MKSIAPLFENPFSSPGFEPPKYWNGALDKKVTAERVLASSIRPPTQIRQQNLKGIEYRVEYQATAWAAYQNTLEYVSKHPNCALNLVCHRIGTNVCELHQIQTILESRFKDEHAFADSLIQNLNLISTNVKFFQTL
jgi:hypothetical protein